MKHPELQAREISPLEDLEIPVYAQEGKAPDPAVRDHNRPAERQLNDNRRSWMLRCLCAIVAREEVGEVELEHLGDPAAQMAALVGKLDPSRLNLTRRPILNAMMLMGDIGKPANDEKATMRHAGDRLTLTYDGVTIGFFEASYNLDGKIHLDFGVPEILTP